MKKFQKLVSFTLILFLLISATVPAVSAEPSEVYYELHDLCICGGSEDLGQIPCLTWGIGYKAWIDKQTDNWEIFVHARGATKKFTITPETDLGKLVTLRDFVNAVKVCKAESEQIPYDIGLAIATGVGGTYEMAKGVLTDNALYEILGAAGIAASAEGIHQAVIHFNNAKTAQKNAEALFDYLKL